MKSIILKLFFLCFLSSFMVSVHAEDRWAINEDGSISWVVNDKQPHSDDIEMSGLQVSSIVKYGVDNTGAFQLNRELIWPMLRTIPNDTHASLIRYFNWNVLDAVCVNGYSLLNEKVRKITHKGKIIVESDFELSENVKLKLTRVLFPSTTLPVFCERYIIENIGSSVLTVEVPVSRSEISTDAKKGVYGSYKLISTIKGANSTILKPGEEFSFEASVAGYKIGEIEQVINVVQEEQLRDSFVSGVWGNLVLRTPDPVINTMFAFAKLRASESIFKTKGGLMHAPGGGKFYAAIWTNDQAEYVNPFFPFLGYENGNNSALNSLVHFARFMNDEYKCIPTSIIAEGTDIWNGAGDRGDCAMIAYGATRYALARGDKKEATELWPLIEWCLEYCKRKLNENGVVTSDSDELEGRFPAGNANLHTSCLYYDALISAVYLGKDLNKNKSQLSLYSKQADEIRIAIEKYFGAEVENFDTYRYFKENDILRSWICTPLTVGIYDRKEETIKALFSPRLWTENGLLTEAGGNTFWDRSTLYALRGVYMCGETKKATDYLKYYSNRRLLGEHVPYAIEAWPENNQRHLSAESGLYCRILTEGMFGIRPTGLKSFILTPRLPKDWDAISLQEVKAFGSSFDIKVTRKNLSDKKLRVIISAGGRNILDKLITDGGSVPVQL